MKTKLFDMGGWVIVAGLATSYLGWVCWEAGGAELSENIVALIRVALFLEVLAALYFAGSDIRTILTPDIISRPVIQFREEEHSGRASFFGRPSAVRENSRCLHRFRRLRSAAVCHHSKVLAR